MSLLKSWKSLTLLITLAVFFISGCAGSGGSSTDSYDSDSYSDDGSASGGGGGEGGKRPAPREKVDTDDLKKTQQEAIALEKENHDLRRQIFELKNKLGIPVEQDEEAK